MTCLAYSDNVDKMKQEAIRRVQEMQKRSRSVLGERSESAETTIDKNESEQHKQDGIDALLGSLLGRRSSSGALFDVAGIPIDEEKALIGMLIYILYKQGADVKLLLGLGYLLL